jgi:hypothetical protein
MHHSTKDAPLTKHYCRLCADLDVCDAWWLRLPVQQLTEVAIQALEHHVHVVAAKPVDDIFQPAEMHKPHPIKDKASESTFRVLQTASAA